MKDNFQESVLISNLSKYRLPEDYLTNVLATLLRELLSTQALNADRMIAFDILDLIARKERDPCWNRNEIPNIKCQVMDGRHDKPDITITSRGPNGLSRKVFVEAKDQAGVDPDQLVDYKTRLSKYSQAKYKCLTLLSRPFVNIEDQDEKAIDVHSYWYQIYQIISDCAKKGDATKYLLDSFRAFMEEKGMNLDKINGSYADVKRLKDLARFTLLLKTGLEQVKNKLEGVKLGKLDVISGKEPWFGFWFTYKGRDFSLGMSINEPQVIELILETSPDYPEKRLDLAKRGIFDKPVEQQLAKLEEFLTNKLPELLEISKAKY